MAEGSAVARQMRLLLTEARQCGYLSLAHDHWRHWRTESILALFGVWESAARHHGCAPVVTVHTHKTKALMLAMLPADTYPPTVSGLIISGLQEQLRGSVTDARVTYHAARHRYVDSTASVACPFLVVGLSRDPDMARARRAALLAGDVLHDHLLPGAPAAALDGGGNPIPRAALWPRVPPGWNHWVAQITRREVELPPAERTAS